MEYFGIISVIVSLLLLALVIWLVITPTPVKYILSRTFTYSPYMANANATITERYTLYKSATSQLQNLIIVFIGGGFLYSSVTNIYGITNYLNEKFQNDYDILTFAYPVRFKHTIHSAMLVINEILKDFINYEHVHAIGVSAGTLLAGAFYQKETHPEKATAMKIPQIGMHFKSFIGLSGIYEPVFNSKVVSGLFKFYIMRNTPSIKHYTCYRMGIAKLVISAQSDFLLAQTSKYIQTEPNDNHIYPSTTLPHAFSQLINLDEARDSLDRVYDFILRVSKEGKTLAISI